MYDGLLVCCGDSVPQDTSSMAIMKIYASHGTNEILHVIRYEIEQYKYSAATTHAGAY